MIVYKITNLINNKIYVGKTTKSINKRFSEHVKESKNLLSKRYLCSAIRKYGKENFSIETIQLCESIEKLNKSEIYWIKELNSKAPNGYNLTNGGDGNNGYIFTDEGREKIRMSLLGRICTESTRVKLHNSLKGRVVPKEEKIKISLSKKGTHLSEEHKNKIKNSILQSVKEGRINHVPSGKENPFYGKRHSKETIEKIKIKWSKKVVQYDLDMNLIKIWNSRKEAANELGIYSQAICNNINNKRKQVSGFIFKNPCEGEEI